jgi:hypothetical protein
MTHEESQSIHGLSRRNLIRAGVLGLGAASVGIASPLLAGSAAQALTYQPDWAYCTGCAQLWYWNAKNTSGVCPYPPYEGYHLYSTSFNYELPYPVDSGTNPQQDWRFCNKCSVLFYSVNQSISVCAAGGKHDSSGSFHYGLNYYSSYPTDDPQGGWYWCGKCQALFVTAYGVGNYCPKTHAAHVTGAGSHNYGITWSGTMVWVPLSG